MSQSRFLGSTALRTAMVASVALAIAAPAAAQQTDQTAPASSTDPASPQAQGNSSSNAAQAVPEEKQVAGEAAAAQGAEGDVVVTGSRIARPNLASTVPITSVTGAELEQTGRVSIGDVLNDLPQLQNTFSQSNSTRFLGTAGLNLLDLYALGTQRTLVLVNGRRHVGSDILNNAVSPDVNTFPTDLIDRVDIVTGGNSAVYGSDAIAGVVNFVLKDHFDGLQAHAQGGASEKGDAGSYYASILAGKNFAGGRGNIAVDVEYARQNQLFASGRDYYSRNNGFVTVDTDAPGVAAGQTFPNYDGIPDRVFERDIRSGTYSNGGLVSFASGRNTFASGVTNPNAGICGRDPTNAPYNCNFLFLPDGTLVPQTGTRTGLASGTTPAGSFLGGNGNTFREGNQVQLLPALDRYSANLIGHFDISDAFVPFIEAKYVRTDVYGTGSSGPAFISGSTLSAREAPRLDNPFLSTQARTLITQQLLAANPAATITDATRFSLRENLVGLGNRAEQSRRETYRIVGGLRGTVMDDWKYEVSANYGEFNERTRVLGNLNIQRFLLAVDSTRNAAGQIVCRSQIDPAARIGYVDEGATLANDVAACVPLNPFGEGNISQAAQNYVLQETTSVGKITQFDANAFMSGDSSQLFELPGGPIGFSLGTEYRRETNSFRADPLVEQGYTFYNALPSFTPPAFEVYEAFGELRLPLLKDLPLIEELTLGGSGRAAHYNSDVGTVYAYSGGVDYFPVQDIHLRANYSRSVRAPNLTELYSAQGQNYAPGFTDPCAAQQIGQGTQYRAANCAAAGIPTTGANAFNYTYASSLEIVSGGNPDLDAETSDSYTFGAVIQPRWTPGLSLSIDYYNIKVNNVITAPSAQQIVNSCYDLPTANNQFCSLFTRDNAAGTITGDPYRIVEGNLQQTLLNYARLQTRGLNTQISYNHRIGSDSQIGARFQWTHYLQNESFLDPTQPNFADTIVSEIGTPRDQFNLNIDGKAGPLFINYQLRYLSKQSITAYEDLNSFQGRAAQNADYADILYYPDVTYHNIRVGLDINDQTNFYFGIDNLTNRLPPLYSTGIGGGSGIFENVGRRFYAGANVRF